MDTDSLSIPEITFPHLGISIDHLSREAFSVFGLSIYWYGVFIFLGIVAGTLSAYLLAKRMKVSFEPYMDFLMWVVPACIVGARLYYVIFSWDEFSGNPLRIFNTRTGGLAIYGAVIAAFITGFVFTRVRKLDFFKFADGAIVGLSIGQCIGRIGNFFNREAFGGYTDSFLAMRYLKSTVDESYITQQIYENIIVVNGAEYIQVHPTFLYEALWNLGLFIFMCVYTRRKKFDGEIMGYYLLVYGLGRFWIEGLRTDQLILFGTGLAVSQLLSLLLVAAALAYLAYNYIKIKKATVS